MPAVRRQSASSLGWSASTVAFGGWTTVGCGKSASVRGKVRGSFALGLTVSEQYVRHCVGSAAARKPGFQNRADLPGPRHGHRTAALEHDDGVRIRRRNFRNQIILMLGK